VLHQVEVELTGDHDVRWLLLILPLLVHLLDLLGCLHSDVFHHTSVHLDHLPDLVIVGLDVGRHVEDLALKELPPVWLCQQLAHVDVRARLVVELLLVHELALLLALARPAYLHHVFDEGKGAHQRRRGA